MSAEMPRPRLPYVLRETTRHGRVVWYFRRGDGPRVRLPGLYGSPEFHVAYQQAMGGAAPDPDKRRAAEPETLHWVIDRYRESADFRALAPSTRRVRERILETIIDSPAAKVAVRRIEAAHVMKSRDRRADRPEAANAYVKTLRAVLDYARRAGLVDRNVARDVDLLSSNSEGFHTWTIDEVEAFEARHPVGTKARLALDIMLYTGLRRSDVVVFGRQHVRQGVITIRTRKTGETVTLRVLQPLADSIAAAPTGDLAFLVTEFGKPFTAAGFGNWFRARCNEAGVPGSAHGLRKTAATRAAEAGATTSELMAMFGWRTAKEAERYTRAANRKSLGLAGANKLAAQSANTKPRTSADGAGKREKSPDKSIA